MVQRYLLKVFEQFGDSVHTITIVIKAYRVITEYHQLSIWYTYSLHRLICYVNNCSFGLGYDNSNTYAPSSREQPALPIPDANYADPWTIQSAQVALLQAAVTDLG